MQQEIDFKLVIDALSEFVIYIFKLNLWICHICMYAQNWDLFFHSFFA